MDENIINEILELNEKMKENVPDKKRFYYTFLRPNAKPFIGIAGLKGSGKTVLLRQYLIEHPDSIYLSLDSIDLFDLYTTVKQLREQRGYKTFLLDEVHFYPNWKRDLKKIYDFLDVNIIFTSSIALDIVKSKYDLSRRVIIKRLPPLSFREYIYFVKNKKLDAISIQDLKNENIMRSISNYDYLFENYINGDLLPAYMDKTREIEDIFGNIMLSIIEKDIPAVERWSYHDVYNIKLMLRFMASSPVDDISYSSISKNVGITKYMAEKYILALEKSFLLNIVEPKGTNVKKEPKILFTPPFRMQFAKSRKYEEGAKREEFFVMSAKFSDMQIFYLKGKRGEKMPDYLINYKNNRYIFEIGGKSKSIAQFKHIKMKAKEYILTYPSIISGIKRPLTSFGFLF